MLDAVVEIRKQRAVQMIVGKVGRERRRRRACRGAAPNLPSPQRPPGGTAPRGRRPGRARPRRSHRPPSWTRAAPGRRRPAPRADAASARSVRSASAARSGIGPGSPVRRSSLPPPNRRWLPPPGLKIPKNAKIAQWAVPTSVPTRSSDSITTPTSSTSTSERSTPISAAGAPSRGTRSTADSGTSPVTTRWHRPRETATRSRTSTNRTPPTA